MRIPTPKALRWTCAIAILLVSRQSFGGAYALTPYLGDMYRSGAGATAAADDASTVFNNPAGMNRLDGRRLTVEAQLYLPSSVFTDAGSTDINGAPLTGNNGGDAGTNTFIPALYYTHRMNDRWALGLSINAPFGLSSKRNRDWVGRYQYIETGIKTLNINPGASYRISDAWSFGFGLNAQYAKAKQSSAIDFGQSFGPPQSADGYLDLEGDDWGYGYNLGVLFSHGKLRLGLTYRSKIDYKLSGTADFTKPAGVPGFNDTSAIVPLVMPEMAAIGFYYQLSDAFAVMANGTWTRWSRVDKLVVDFQNGQPDISIPRNFRDTWRWAIGFDYRLAPKWRLQWGAATAKSAVPDSTYNGSIPTTDAYWVTLGAQYTYSPTLGFGFGFNHIIFKNRDVNHTGSTFGDTLRGTLDPGLDVIGAQVHWKM
ncbi:MAG TPA: outer membrane protein transport protein [Gammaproteobacteria bacterium]|nr:outer membrane protein transport protein [Gammaproteobacteria bacterium]